MSPLNTLIKSWKIQNVRTAKHTSVFKVFFNKRNYAPMIIILIKWLFQRRMNILLFLRKKNYRIYVKFITNGVCQQNAKTVHSLFS